LNLELFIYLKVAAKFDEERLAKKMIVLQKVYENVRIEDYKAPGLFSSKKERYPEPNRFEDAQKYSQQTSSEHKVSKIRLPYAEMQVKLDSFIPVKAAGEKVGEPLPHSGEKKWKNVEDAMKKAKEAGLVLGLRGCKYIANIGGKISFFGNPENGGVGLPGPDLWRIDKEVVVRPDAYVETGFAVDGDWQVHPWVYSPNEWEDLDALDDTKEGIIYKNGGNKLGLNLEKKSARVKRRLLTRPMVEEAEGTVFKGINGEVLMDGDDELSRLQSAAVMSGQTALDNLHAASDMIHMQKLQTGATNETLDEIHHALNTTEMHFESLESSTIQILLRSKDWVQRQDKEKCVTAFHLAGDSSKSIIVPSVPGVECCVMMKKIIPATWIQGEHHEVRNYKIRACGKCLYIIDINGKHPALHTILEYSHIRHLSVGWNGEVRIHLKNFIYKKNKAPIDKTGQMLEGSSSRSSFKPLNNPPSPHISSSRRGLYNLCAKESW